MMKREFTKLMAAFALLAFLAIPMGMWGQTASFAPSDFNGQGTSGTGSAISATVDGVTFACDKGYGTTQIRCYSGGVITISSSNTITAISFTLSGSYTGGLETSYTNLSTTSWTKTLSSQARITACSVSYTSGDTPQPTTYTVTYDCNGGTSGCPQNVTGIEPNTQIQLADAPSKDGFDFDGWSDGNTTYGENEDYTVTGNVTFTAQWTENTTPTPGGTTATLNIEAYADANNWTNGTKYQTAIVFPVSFVANGGGNTGKYYSSGEDWRFYQNESASITISVPEGYTLVSVKPTFTVGNSGVLKNGNTTIASGTTVSVSGTSVTFTVGNSGTATNGQVKFTNIDVVYVSDGGTPASSNEYVLYTGELVEGDYLIVYDGYAMNTTVDSDRLQYEEVTATSNVIYTDNAEIVWHIAKSGDYWTIYNADADAYAASTGVKNKAQMLADGTDDKALWTVSGTYEFVNKQNSANNVNANLRKNGTYGFACYATSTGGALSLYKKVVTTETHTLTVDGYTGRFGYVLIASPVTVDPSTVEGMTTGDYDLYYFNEEGDIDGNQWINYKDQNDGGFSLEPGKGYLYAKAATQENPSYSFELTGMPYDGQPIVLRKIGNGNFMGWNLVGNPLGETAVLADSRDFYVMNPAGSEFIQSSGAIDPMQGIFVIAEQDREELVFEAAGVATNPIDDNKLVLNLTQGRNAIDRAVVRFGEGRTLPKFMLNPSNTKLYITKDDQDFAVVRSANQGEMPVSFKAAENGTYTLTIAAENVEVSYLHLIDNMSRADIDLLANPSYTFTAQTTDNEDRFTLVYSKAPAGQTLPYSYGFEDNDLATDGWTAQITSTSSGINSAAAHTGSLGFRFQYSENPGYLVSPLLTGGGTNGIELSFYYKEYSSSYGDENFQVGYTTDVNETDPSNFTYGEIIEASTSWQQHTETLPAGTVRMAIKYLYVDAFYLYLDDFTFEVSNPCSKPTDLAVTTDGQTATVTWDGTAANNFIVTVNNGTPATGQTSPYTFNVDLSSTYEVTVMADCGAVGTSNPESISFSTPDCIGGRVIEYTLNDSFGDGWNGNAIQVYEGCGNLIATLTIENGSEETGTLVLCGDYYEFIWVNGSYPGETSFTFTEGGTTLFTKPSSVSDGLVLYTIGTQAMLKPTDLTAGTPEAHSVALSWTENGTATAWQICVNGDENNLIDVTGRPSYTLDRLASETAYTVKVRSTDRTGESCWSAAVTFTTAESSCTKPTNLAEANISFTTADLSWNGTSESYVLQYRPWYPAGDDIIATGVTTTYTVDLSAYEGTGSVAIRHYDISDMFRLNVDDIVVTNANGQVVFSENFESGVMPSTFNNMDLDGDGYVWEIVTNGTDSHGNPTGNGTYCMASASYDNNYGPLTPDNWIIMSGLEMGGQISFAARGQDPSYAAENFAIYVSTDNSVVEVPVSATTYSLADLTPNTPYAWQVKGICSDDESSFASSFFKTKDDMLVFATTGDWNVVSNWEDAEGNAVTALPTAENNVRIDADATIPAGVVAVANKATIGTGSITIEDGGQLKQNAASLRVTMEKEIAGYGTSDGNYYFIASPFNGRTLYETSGTFSHVDNMLTGEYDLYAFDAAASDGLEWINYKSEPTHIAFQAENELAGLLYGEGYLYANQEGTTLEFEGTAGKSNNYSETKDYTFDSESTNDFNGWALVGNFFTCNAYINYIDANGNVLDADFYTLNLDNTYSLMTSGQPLPPCTGALMNVSATGKVQYSTEAPANSKASMLNITLNQNRSIIDQVRMRFGQGYNMQHMSFRKGSSKVYMPVEGKDYAVVYTENQGEMPVNFKAENNGSYTLSFNTEEVSFAYLHLIDNMTGNDVNLLETPSYSFEAKTTDYESRFKLVFATGNANDDNFAFFSNGSFVINNEGNATLQVIDVNGRIIKNESINGCANVSINQASGIYMLRLVNGDSVKVQKVVVK